MLRASPVAAGVAGAALLTGVALHRRARQRASQHQAAQEHEANIRRAVRIGGTAVAGIGTGAVLRRFVSARRRSTESGRADRFRPFGHEPEERRRRELGTGIGAGVGAVTGAVLPGLPLHQRATLSATLGSLGGAAGNAIAGIGARRRERRMRSQQLGAAAGAAVGGLLGTGIAQQLPGKVPRAPLVAAAGAAGGTAGAAIAGSKTAQRGIRRFGRSLRRRMRRNDARRNRAARAMGQAAFGTGRRQRRGARRFARMARRDPSLRHVGQVGRAAKFATAGLEGIAGVKRLAEQSQPVRQARAVLNAASVPVYASGALNTLWGLRFANPRIAAQGLAKIGAAATGAHLVGKAVGNAVEQNTAKLGTEVVRGLREPGAAGAMFQGLRSRLPPGLAARVPTASQVGEFAQKHGGEIAALGAGLAAGGLTLGRNATRDSLRQRSRNRRLQRFARNNPDRFASIHHAATKQAHERGGNASTAGSAAVLERLRSRTQAATASGRDFRRAYRSLRGDSPALVGALTVGAGLGAGVTYAMRPRTEEQIAQQRARRQQRRERRAQRRLNQEERRRMLRFLQRSSKREEPMRVTIQ